jgi:drug/metabolite transporter (DMT)-like permease
VNKKITGGSLLLLSTLIYGMYGIFARKVSVFGPFSQGMLRFSVVVLAILIILLLGKFKWKRIEKGDIKWFLIWIIPASFQQILTFIAFNNLPIGLVYFLLYSTMILGGIISGKIFFSEIFTKEKTVSLFLVMVGLFLIYRSDLTLITSIYVFFALGSGLLVGFWNTLSKKVSGNYSEFQIIFLDSLSTLTISLIGFFATKESLPSISNISSWVWIIIFALAGLGSTYFLIRGFKYVEAQVGSLILPMELIFASIFGYFFFKEILSYNIYFGGILIFCAAIIPTLKLRK